MPAINVVPVIGYVTRDERERFNSAAESNHESLSQMIGRLLREESAKLERKQRRAQAQKTEQMK